MSVKRSFILAAVAALAGNASAIIIATGAPGAGTTTQWDGVGEVLNGFDPGTGTMLDNSHILTAAHLVFDNTSQTTLLASSINFNLSGTNYPISNVKVHSSYTGGGQYDIAVLTLATPLNGHTTYGYNTGSLNELTVKSATIVGYGKGGDGTTGFNGTLFPYGTKREATNNIDLVTTLTGTTVTDKYGQTGNLPPGVIAWDFSTFSPTSPSPLGGTVSGANEGDIVFGDSGAPVFQFDSTASKYIITGVAVDGTDFASRFGQVSWATRTSTYSSFISTSVPEPTSLALIAIASLGMMGRRRKAQ